MIMFSGGDKGPRMFLRERLSVFADIWFNPRGKEEEDKPRLLGSCPSVIRVPALLQTNEKEGMASNVKCVTGAHYYFSSIPHSKDLKKGYSVLYLLYQSQDEPRKNRRNKMHLFAFKIHILFFFFAYAVV